MLSKLDDDDCTPSMFIVGKPGNAEKLDAIIRDSHGCRWVESSQLFYAHTHSFYVWYWDLPVHTCVDTALFKDILILRHSWTPRSSTGSPIGAPISESGPWDQPSWPVGTSTSVPAIWTECLHALEKPPGGGRQCAGNVRSRLAEHTSLRHTPGEAAAMLSGATPEKWVLCSMSGSGPFSWVALPGIWRGHW